MKLAPAIFREIHTSSWSFSPQGALAAIEMLSAFRAGVEIESAKISPYNLQLNSDNSIDDKSVGILPIKGIISKSDFCGAPGTETYEKWLADFESDDSVIGVVLKIDSGGGQSQAGHSMAEAVAKFTKPIVAFIDDEGASAAYNIAAKADKVLLKNDLTAVGSIGTLIQLSRVVGEIKSWSGNTIETKRVYGSLSQLKNEEWEAWEQKGDTDKIQKLVDIFDHTFTNSMLQERPGLSKAAQQGKMFYGQAGIKNGLADAIASLNEAAQEVISLSEKRNSNLNTMSKNLMEIDIDQYNGLIRQQATLNAVEALFGESANAEGFNVINAVQNAISEKKELGTDASHIAELFGKKAESKDFDLMAAVQSAIADQEKLPLANQRIKALEKLPGAEAVDVSDQEEHEEPKLKGTLTAFDAMQAEMDKQLKNSKK